MHDTLVRHWPEYLCEAVGLGLFMLSATGFAVLLFHPGSILGPGDPLVRRTLMGLAMGGTAAAIVYSRLGQRSGAHLNPAMTLTFFRLGKVAGRDALFYVAAQFLGGLTGMSVATVLFRRFVGNPSVNYVVTVPGPSGVGAAFLAEALIAGLLMTVVLAASNTPALARFTGLFAAALVAAYITVEAPISGMSMNPARTVASAVPAGLWTAWWLYLTAPLLGMLLAAEAHRAGRHPVVCAKLHHTNAVRCIFRCGHGPAGVVAGAPGKEQA